ncbi:22329_t:CDS:2 [Dentiscutata erythropus]|uniref:22329_t:CDS:1 n=1 Tax=Dentiscutata erythropus TaxID=1348616 RepID=A0A9N9FFS5_9GLOM|nr:22329_t:CDS:2 [Dentiscutata erythropus]
MISNSDNSHVKIPIEEAPDKSRKILEIVCSPNMKHVAALDEDSNISLWTQEQLLENKKTIHIDNICTKEKGKRIFAISDDKYVSISLYRVDPYNFKIFDFETEKEIPLTFPDWQNEIDFLSFICNGKLIIFNDTIYEITMCDIEELSIKSHILIEWDCTLESIKISDDEELLLLYISGEQYKLMDSYNLKNPIDAQKIQELYIIRSYETSDKIIYMIDGKVLIDELVPDNWVEYLRKELKDTNNIIAPDDKKRHLDILPSFYPNEKNFILHCEVLENDDLISITRIGLIIWTYKHPDIKMLYYWNDWNGCLEDFDFEKTKKNAAFQNFFEDNIVEEFYLTCYGKILLKIFTSLRDDKWIEFLGEKCIDKCLQNNNHLISKITLLSIIFENFKELSEKHPRFIANILSKIGFVVPSTIVIPNSNSSHLSSYGRYPEHHFLIY